MYYIYILIFAFSAHAQTSKPVQPVSVNNWPFTMMSSAPGSDTGQSALPVRIISQLGAGAGGSSASQVSILNFPATQAVSFTTPLSVTGSFYPATQPISGSVSVSNFPTIQSVSYASSVAIPVTIATMPTTTVTGPLTDTQLRASAVPVSLSSTTVSNFPSIQNVSYASSATVPVTGVFWQSTQPVSISGTVATSNTQLPSSLGAKTTANALAVAIASDQIVLVSYDSSTPVPVTESGSWTASISTQAAANSNPIGSVSLGNSLGKTIVMKAASFASSAGTADQVAASYTVTTGKTFYLEYFDVGARLTSYAATATLFGTCSLESPAGTKLWTQMLAGTGSTVSPLFEQLAEPVPIASATNVRIVCTPSAATGFTWWANIGGYEK